MSADPLSLIAKRGAQQLRRRVLPVDYYRIRRRLALELPMRSLPSLEMPIKGIPAYPWGTWAMWALEERVLALGWTGHWLCDEACRRLATEQLSLMTTWPRHEDWGGPDLVQSHCLRIMVSSSHWPWIDADTQLALRQCCSKIVELGLAWSEKRHGSLTSVQSILDADDCERAFLANIPVIAAVSLARAARFAQHPALEMLDRRASILIRAILLRSKRGFSEGAIYDGYVLDFVGDWLADAGDAAEPKSWDAPALTAMLAQSSILASPGDPMNVAPLGDVEPWHMPFFASGCAKLLPRVADVSVASYLRSLPPAALRTDTLVAMLRNSTNQPPEPSRTPAAIKALAQQTAHAVALRTGHTDDDLAVVVSLTRTLMGHLHTDSGNIVIGAAGKWLITDPGYQQYMPTSERDFSVGPCAHNLPIIKGHAQTLRLATLQKLSETDDLRHARVDLSACYPAEAAVKSVSRHVWLWQNHVVVADDIVCDGPHTASYTWHGDEAAFWLASDRGVCVTLPGHGEGEGETDGEDTLLWIASPGLTLSSKHIDRLRGSRGQLSLCVQTECASHASTRWWVFTRGTTPADVQIVDDARTVIVSSRRLSVAGD
jgi:hypothetical protein